MSSLPTNEQTTIRRGDLGGAGTTPPRSSRAPVERALIAMLLALLLGALMNAESLADTAERQPFGWQRTTAVAVVRPLEVVADATGLGGINAWLTDSVGGWFRQAPGRGAPTADGPGDRAGEGSPGGEPADGAQDDDARSAPSDEPRHDHATDTGPTGGHPAAEAPTDADAEPTQGAEEGLEPRRAPTEDDPLEVWLTGDSLVEAIGSPLDTALNESLPATVRTDPNYATGLARPDYFDWHAYAEESLTDQDPDVVVMMMGGNDDQDVRDADGQVLRHDADEWEDEYRRRAEALLDRLATEERDVFWIGMPVMQDPEVDERMRRIDRIYAEATEAEPRAEHLPTRDLFTVDGGYASYMELDDGGVERVRRDDGLHLTFAGGRLLVDRRLSEAIVERWSQTP